MIKYFRFLFCLVPFIVIFSVSSFAVAPDPDLYVVSSVEFSASDSDGYYTLNNIIASTQYYRLPLFTNNAQYLYIDVPSSYPLPASFIFNGFSVGSLPSEGFYQSIGDDIYNKLIDIPTYYNDINYPWALLSIPSQQYPFGVTPPTIKVYLLSDSEPELSVVDLSEYDIVSHYTMSNLRNHSFINSNGSLVNSDTYRSAGFALNNVDYVFLHFTTDSVYDTSCCSAFGHTFDWYQGSNKPILFNTFSIRDRLIPVPSGFSVLHFSVRYNHSFDLYFLKNKAPEPEDMPSFDSSFSPDIDNPDIGSGDDLSTDLPVIDFTGGGSVSSLSSSIPSFGNGAVTAVNSGLSSTFNSDDDLFLDPSDGLPFSEFMSQFMARGVFSSFWPFFLFSLIVTIIMGIIKALLR